jgi:hypothetical protein
MVALFWFLLELLTSPFKSNSRLEAENAALRHQPTVLRRKVRGRVQLTNGDRLFLVQLFGGSLDLEGHHHRPTRDPRALAPCGLSPLLLRWLFSPQSNTTLDLFAAAPFWLLCELMNGVVAAVVVTCLLPQLDLELAMAEGTASGVGLR